jgi:hypothetical protein
MYVFFIHIELVLKVGVSDLQFLVGSIDLFISSSGRCFYSSLLTLSGLKLSYDIGHFVYLDVSSSGFLVL